MSVLRTKNLSIGYSNKKSGLIRVAEGLNYTLKKGQLAAVVGVNGIGKSTLIKSIAGLIPPVQGNILLSNQDLSDLRDEDRAREISLVLTRRNAAPNLLVSEVLALGRQPYLPWWGKLGPEDQRQIEKVSEQLSLHPLLHRNCGELSDGQLQKVFLGRALVQDTPLILLDEPTTHLDMEHKAEILLLLKYLAKEENKAILFSTHDLEWALEVCDSIWLLNGAENPVCTSSEFVQTGLYSSLFSDDFVFFDQKTQRFRLQQNRYL